MRALAAVDATAAAVEAEGARPVWFEELGRDADPEEAYLAGVDVATIYIGVLNEQYGRLLATGLSATEAEYLRAREGGKRIAVYTAADAPRPRRPPEPLHRARPTVVTTESYRDIADLERRVRRRHARARCRGALAVGEARRLRHEAAQRGLLGCLRSCVGGITA